jgi:rod shape-determining protein MreC
VVTGFLGKYMKKIFSSRTLVSIIVAFIVIVSLIAGSNWWAKRTNTPPFLQRFGNDLAVALVVLLLFQRLPLGVQQIVLVTC